MNIHIATLTFSKYVYSNQNLTSLSCSFRGDDFIITCNHPIKSKKQIRWPLLNIQIQKRGICHENIP